MDITQSNQGFTLIELLIVIAIVGILATVLVPAVFSARVKANDTAAAVVAQRVATATAAVQVNNMANSDPTCTFNNPNVVVISGAETIFVPSSRPVTNVDCTKNVITNNIDVRVTYIGGSQTNIVASVQQ